MKDVVKLTVTHEEITSGLEDITNGWQAIISNLKSLLETGQPLSAGIWHYHEEKFHKTA